MLTYDKEKFLKDMTSFWQQNNDSWRKKRRDLNKTRYVYKGNEKQKIKTFDEYLTYIKDKDAVIYTRATCDNYKDLDDVLKRSYVKHIRFFDNKGDRHLFCKSIKFNFDKVIEIKDYLLHNYNSHAELKKLAISFYEYEHDDYIDFRNVFRFIHHDDLDVD